jgi:recombination protein RecT
MSTEIKKQDPIQSVRTDLNKMESQFKAALPSHISVEKFTRVVMTAIQTNPDILNADRKTLYSSCILAAQDGLLPNGKEAALVIYRTKAGPAVQYIPMISGILKKVRNSGDLATITAQIVYEKDDFTYFVDSEGEHIEHRPIVFADRGKEIGCYAIAKTKEGDFYIELMSKADIMKVKASSRAQNGPWSGSFEHEMWKKTVVRRLSKRLPMSSDLEAVITRDDNLYDLESKPQNDKASQLEKLISSPEIIIEESNTQEKIEEDEPTAAPKGLFDKFNSQIVAPTLDPKKDPRDSIK